MASFSLLLHCLIQNELFVSKQMVCSFCEQKFMALERDAPDGKQRTLWPQHKSKYNSTFVGVKELLKLRGILCLI